MKKLIIIILFSFVSCSNKPEIELEILNNTLISRGYSREDLSDDFKNPDNGLNIVRYRIVNNSKKIYYFNRSFFYSDVVQKNYIPEGKIDFFQNSIFFDKNSKTASLGNRTIHLNEEEFQCLLIEKKREQKILDCFRYDSKKRNAFFEKLNFILHPGESKYFEYILHLPFDETGVDNSDFVFKKDGEYFFQIQLFSDSTNLKESLTWPEMEAIKNNKFEVFHGAILSKNKVPVKVVK